MFPPSAQDDVHSQSHSPKWYYTLNLGHKGGPSKAAQLSSHLKPRGTYSYRFDPRSLLSSCNDVWTTVTTGLLTRQRAAAICPSETHIPGGTPATSQLEVSTVVFSSSNPSPTSYAGQRCTNNYMFESSGRFILHVSVCVCVK